MEGVMTEGIKIVDVKEWPAPPAEPSLFDVLSGLPTGRAVLLDKKVFTMSDVRGALGQTARQFGKRFEVADKEDGIWIKMRTNGNGHVARTVAPRVSRSVRNGTMVMEHRRNKYPLITDMGKPPYGKNILKMVSRNGGVTIRTSAFNSKGSRHSLVFDLRHKWGCDIVGTGCKSRELTVTRRRRKQAKYTRGS